MERLDKPVVLTWISRMPWATADELAAVLGVDPGTISRHLSDRIADGLVVSRETGHPNQRSRRFLLTAKGLLAHPDQHSGIS